MGPAAPGIWAPPRTRLTLGVVTLILVAAFEAVAVTTAMPTVAHALGGLRLYALAFALPLATSIVGMVLSGRWADRRGPRPVMVAGVVAFAAGLLLAGLAPTMWFLTAGRGVQGLGAGMISVGVYVVIAQCYPSSLRPKVFSATAAAWVLPALVGPLVAGALVDHVGWRWVFIGVLPVTLVASVLVWPALADTGPRRPGAPAGVPVPTGGTGRRGWRARLGWAVLAAASASLLHVAGQERGAGAVLMLAAALAGIVLSAPRLLPEGTLTLGRGLPSVVAVRGLAGAAFLSCEAFLPLMLQQLRGFSPTGAGLGVAAGSLAWAAGSWWQGRAGEAVDRHRMLGAGLAVLSLGALGTTLAGWAAVPVGLPILAWALAGLGIGIAYPNTSHLGLGMSPPDRLGDTSSALTISEALGTSVALAVAGTAFTALLLVHPTAAFVSAGTLAAGLALVGALASRRTRATTAVPG